MPNKCHRYAQDIQIVCPEKCQRHFNLEKLTFLSTFEFIYSYATMHQRQLGGNIIMSKVENKPTVCERPSTILLTFWSTINSYDIAH